MAICSLTHLNHLLCTPLFHRVTPTAVSLISAYLSDPILIFALYIVVFHSHFFIVLDTSKIKSLSLIMQINSRLDLLSLKKRFGHSRRKKNSLAHSNVMLKHANCSACLKPNSAPSALIHVYNWLIIIITCFESKTYLAF